MLESLSIRNFAIIDELTVEFSPGLTVITGETGAGKSIVADALELVLGARSSTELIRGGEEFLSVTGVFRLDSLPGDGEFAVEAEDGMYILRREIRADGSGRCYINDRPVTLRALKSLGDRLVDLHGQHDHQSLLAVPEHIRFLDGFGGLVPLAREVAGLHAGYTGVLAAIDSLRERIAAGLRDRELFRFQLEEIRDAAIKPDEDTGIEREILRLSRAADLKLLGMQAFSELSDGEGSVVDRLGGLSARIGGLARFDSALESLLGEIRGIAGGVGDLAREFRAYGERVEDDPAALAELEDRLAVIEKLKKKYGPSLDEVFAYYQKISGETEGIEHLEESLAERESEAALLHAQFAERAELLSRKRHEAAPRLAGEVEAHLRELGMSGARLTVRVSPCENGCEITAGGKRVFGGRNGFDDVEFLIATNPGEPPRSLVKAASGGEVSRVMLSMKLALNETDSVPTMVFDEIDTGVSGRIAEAVGLKLRKLAESRQTIAITHLPQIAAMGDSHFSARKQVEDNRTRTRLVALDDAMRAEEIAAMLSGAALTETALAHAWELLGRRKRNRGE